MAKTDLSKGILSRYERLEGQRQNWETHWQEVADYMQPRKADVTKKRARGDKRMEMIFDSSPIQAIELLAASLHGMLTNPSTPWFTLRFKDEDIDNEDEAKLWLEASQMQCTQHLIDQTFNKKYLNCIMILLPLVRQRCL